MTTDRAAPRRWLSNVLLPQFKYSTFYEKYFSTVTRLAIIKLSVDAIVTIASIVTRLTPVARSTSTSETGAIGAQILFIS